MTEGSYGHKHGVKDDFVYLPLALLKERLEKERRKIPNQDIMVINMIRAIVYHDVFREKQTSKRGPSRGNERS